MNDEALLNYLSFQFNPLAETFFAGIHRLDPGCYAVISLADEERKAQRCLTLKVNDSRTSKSISSNNTAHTVGMMSNLLTISLKYYPKAFLYPNSN